jgi:hypothetical protein
MSPQSEQPDPDYAGAFPEIQTAEIAHLLQSGAIPSRALAEAIDALATGGVEELPESEQAIVALPPTAKNYRAFRLGLPAELQTLHGLYLIMDDHAIELAQLDRDGRPPAGRWKRWLWVQAVTRKIRVTLKKFLVDCYSTETIEEGDEDNAAD